MEGELKHWNEDKGFGFISSKEEPKDIFIHISALKKMSRRPRVGDLITFQIHIDNNGKKRATNAQINGVSPISSKRTKQKRTHSNNLLIKISIFALLTVAAYFIYSNISKNKALSIKQTTLNIVTPVKQKIETAFSCQGKVYCSEMTSCREAKFYLNNCKGTKIDGDNDGVPCEKQWCN